MTSEKLAFHTSIWWKCDSCGTTFSPGSEQSGVYVTIGKKLCVPCIGKIDAKINNMKDTPMKPFNASEFISNQETPVVDKSGEKVEIISTKARGEYPVLGHVGTTAMLYRWSPRGHYYAESPLHDDRNLFFATKVEVIHVFERKDGGGTEFVRQEDDGDDDFHSDKHYTYLGTITGPIVPPEKESGVVK